MKASSHEIIRLGKDRTHDYDQNVHDLESKERSMIVHFSIENIGIFFKKDVFRLNTNPLKDKHCRF